MEEVNGSGEFEMVIPKDRRADGLGELRVLPDEILCSILVFLTPRDVARLSCASSVMYILCNEEPLWMSLCLNNVNAQLQYKGSWKKTTLHELQVVSKYEEPSKKPLCFDGFNSLFLYRRLYRCYTQLSGFSFDHGNVERKTDLSLEEFHHQYDGQKPVLISGLADTWTARSTWTPDQLLAKYGCTTFKISQRSARKVTMKFEDYVSYMKMQHDEDPLYIFDDKFGEVEPDLLKDYSVPHLFQEDYFDVLDRDQRPAFRWLIIGPERSGASWHVDPALTSAWNTLLCGRKRWAMYPPGRVPAGVTVHVNDEDGDVNIDTPTSLQWWLDFYPHLADQDKPIECTQLPGETIFVPSGWWHCVLNLETTVAVTQNFVNSKNFEFVCLDLAPGYQHKGVCRAGLLALDEGCFEVMQKNASCLQDNLSYSDMTRKEKRVKTCEPLEDPNHESTMNGASEICMSSLEYSYDVNFLAMFLDKEKDHYNSLWSSGNCIGQREMRDWLWKLWLGKPGLRDLIWKGACLALNASKWSACMEHICSFHALPSPADDEKLPVGTGSNPVYLVADNVIKVYVEDGLEATLHALVTELEFYSLLSKSESTLKDHVPDVLASGLVFLDNGSYKIMPWDGKGIPDVIARYDLVQKSFMNVDYPFGIWSKKEFEYRKAGISIDESFSSGGSSGIWPYIVTKRCKGKIFAELRDTLSFEDILKLASFLGKQVRNLHLLPVPHLKDLTLSHGNKKFEDSHVNNILEDTAEKIRMPAQWELLLGILNRKKKDVCNRLTKWGHPIPTTLIEKVDDYIPTDFTEFLDVFKDDKGLLEMSSFCSWIHSDVMDDNIHMESCSDADIQDNNYQNGSSNSTVVTSWRPNYILDFSNLSLGDPILDIIPVHLDVFRGDSVLLKKFMECYGLPLGRKLAQNGPVDKGSKYQRISYRAMCYCIVHEDNILGAIFGMWKELRTAKSWEEVEEAVWGQLNNYAGDY